MPSRIVVPLIIACALFMENLDSTVLATALPAIAADLGEDPVRLKLALTSYLLSLAIFIPASGWMADRFGARTVFGSALVVFIAGSVLCALSSTIGELVAARILQGLGGAMMVPVGRLVILKTVPKHELVGAMAWLTVPALIGPVLGPPLGGFITTYFSWRWIFWINVPIGMVGLVLACLYVPDVRGESRQRFDGFGFLLSAVGLSALVTGATTLGLDILPRAIVLTCLAGGALLLGAYIIHARRAPAPILDLTLLRIPTFRAAIVGGGLFRIGIGATPFLLPLMLQLGFGMTPFESGMVTFAGAIGAIMTKFVAQPILRRFGFRNILIINAVICGGFAAIPAAYSEATPILLITMILLTGGLFRSLQFTSISTIAFADIEPERMSRATSMTSVTQQVALAVGISLGALMLELTTDARHTGIYAVDDFAPAFLVIGAVSGVAALIFHRLPRDAGSEVSGHARKAAGAVVTQMRERG